MTGLTRRQALQGLGAGLLGAFAGCNISTEVTHRVGPRPPENVERDPENYALRNPADEPPAWIRQGDTEGGERVRHYPNGGLIARAERADRIAYADVEGVEGAKSFVRGTDFQRETLLLEPYSVEACFERTLCAITWSATEYHTYYARRYKPADYRCGAEEEETAVRFVRIPAALDPGEVTRTGSFSSTGGCPTRRQMDLPPTGSPTTAVNTSTGGKEGR